MLHYLLCIILIVQNSDQSNILILSTITSHSHSLWCSKLAWLLAERGHEVTIVDTDPPRKIVSNLTTYVVEGAYNLVQEFDYQEVSAQTSLKFTIDTIFDYAFASCKNEFLSPVFKKFVDEQRKKPKPFDMIIHDMTFCECFLGVVHHLGNPKLMAVTAFSEPTNVLYIMRNQQNFIHNPLHLLTHSHPMSVIQKVENLFYSLYYHFKYLAYLEKMDSLSKELFGSSTPHVLDIARKSSLALVNSHPILDGAKYYSPAMIPVAGFHIEDPKKLDEKIEAFLDGAKDGVIYFSLGSNFLSSYMSQEKIDMFLNVFRTLKQRVLWKFEENLSNIPNNVLISKWIRQSDVLGHPNVRIFISHMGLLGTQESMYHGVPMIGMPIIADQHFILQKLINLGVAIRLSYVELTEEKLHKTIQEMLINKKYTTEMKRCSKIFRDRPVNPRELAVFWIEYALKNDDLEFLQPPEAYTGALELFFFDTKVIVCVLTGFFLFIVTKYCCYKPCKNIKKIKIN